MLTYEKAIKRPKASKAITGMTRPLLDLPHADVVEGYNGAEAAGHSKRPRERNAGAGCRSAPSLQNRLPVLLFCRMYPDCLRDGVFNVGQAPVSGGISYLEPVARMCIPICPKRCTQRPTRPKAGSIWRR